MIFFSFRLFGFLRKKLRMIIMLMELNSTNFVKLKCFAAYAKTSEKIRYTRIQIGEHQNKFRENEIWK